MAQTKKKPEAGTSRRPSRPEARPHTVTVIEFVEVKGKVQRGEKLTRHEDLLKELGLAP